MEPYQQLLLPLLILGAGVPLAILSGRAKAERMRELRDDLANRRPAGVAVVAVVVILVIVSQVV